MSSVSLFSTQKPLPQKRYFRKNHVFNTELTGKWLVHMAQYNDVPLDYSIQRSYFDILAFEGDCCRVLGGLLSVTFPDNGPPST
jgi:hypothetical protein